MNASLIKLIVCLFVTPLFYSANGQSPYLEWITSYGGLNQDYGSHLAIDQDENVLVVGSFTGTIDADPGPDSYELNAVGIEDLFIQKLTSDGTFLWAKSFGSDYIERCNKIVTDDIGNIYLAGRFAQTMDFDPGPDVFELTAIASMDCFLLKLNQDGEFIWAKSFGGSEWDEVLSIALDPDNNIYLTGQFEGLSDFDPSSASYELMAVGNIDAFVLKLNNDGEFIWVKPFGGTLYDTGYSIIVDELGDVYVAGEFGDHIDFDPGPEVDQRFSKGGWDVFVLKLKSDGQYLWAYTVGGVLDDRATDLSLDGANNVYVTGSFLDLVDFDPGPGDINLTTSEYYSASYILKLNTDGVIQWAKHGQGDQGSITSLYTDQDGNSYITGEFTNATTVNFGFEQKLDSEGEYIWGLSHGNSVSTNILPTPSGDVLVTGFFGGTATFYFPASLELVDLISNGSSDVFVMRLDNDGLVNVKEETTEIPLSFYPNPTSGELQISLKEVYSGLSIKVRNIQGQLISTQKFQNTNLVQLKLAVPAGLYFVEVKTTTGKTGIIKLVKE